MAKPWPAKVETLFHSMYTFAAGYKKEGVLKF